MFQLWITKECGWEMSLPQIKLVTKQSWILEETMQPVREIACFPGLDKGSYCLRNVLGWN